MKRRILYLCSASAMAVVLITALMPPAANASVAQCPSTYICFYKHANYGTLMYKLQDVNYNRRPPSANTQCVSFGSAYNDQTSSIVNKTDYGWQVFRDTKCSLTASSFIHPNSRGNMNSTWNDKISSFIMDCYSPKEPNCI